jgi:hypothetical protein
MLKHILILLILLVPVVNNAGSDIAVQAKSQQTDIYTSLNLAGKGLSSDVFRLALKGYQKLQDQGKLLHSGILTIVDFSQSSKNKRLYVIDLLNKVLLFNTYVAHGRNTGEEYATHFSNVFGSYESSLGFYITKEMIRGSAVGLSLVLDGVEKGFNDNARKREIILHGAAYATEKFISRTGRLGRSFGCPALPPDQVKPVAETIRDGTCLFIYHKDDFYISHSTFLN